MLLLRWEKGGGNARSSLLNVCSSIFWGRGIKLQACFEPCGFLSESLLLVGVGAAEQRRLTSLPRSTRSHGRTFPELGSLEASVKGQKTGLGRD